jgi:hypothetical protein
VAYTPQIATLFSGISDPPSNPPDNALAVPGTLQIDTITPTITSIGNAKAGRGDRGSSGIAILFCL